ncbi:MAG: ABC transporter ATP-binding protein [Bdellovibrionota bacterium]
MQPEKAIQVLALEKIYKEGFWRSNKPSLKNVSFDVPAGQIFGFLGANGAGKTTTIKIALGLQSATSGEVRIFGKSSESSDARTRIGFLPERPYFHLNLDANEFLNFHRRLYGDPQPGKSRPTNEQLLKEVGLADVGGRLLRNFSKGMLQRVGLAQALINDPDLVILDEPMSGLDPVGRREVRNLMVELNRKGKTVFFSSHILSDIESICQQIAFLEKGELKYCGKIEDLVEQGSREFEILFRLEEVTSRKAELAQLGAVQDLGKLMRLSVQGEKEARRATEKLWSMGAQVQSFSPVQRSLEDILFGEKGGMNDVVGSLRNRV